MHLKCVLLCCILRNRIGNAGVASMKDGILLACMCGQTTVIVRLQYELTFAQLIDHICEKFDGLVSGAVCMLFDVPGGANEFHEVLCKYAVEHGFQFKYVKNDSVRITVVCKFAADTGCAWSVHTRVLLLSGVLCVKRFDGVHTCGAAVRTYKNPRTESELVSSVVADQVREQALIRPMDMVFNLKNDYGLDISYRIACLCVKKAMGEVYGDHAMSFDQLRWYSESVMEKNPNSYFNLEFDQKSGRFIRYFILFRACIDGFNHCRPLLFLDRTFLKGRFKGNFLVATVKDSNQGLFPVAFTIIDSENLANWEWFLRN
ncbi:hypothetical protein ACSBR1_032817 [Camellia fascicularis]